jgi:hypothetical protein
VKRDGRASVLRACSILDAPSDLGLRRTGVDGLPDALRAAGLLEGLPDVRYAGRLAVPPYVPLRDPSTAVLNPDGIRMFSLRLAERVAFTIDSGGSLSSSVGIAASSLGRPSRSDGADASDCSSLMGMRTSTPPKQSQMGRWPPWSLPW